MRSINIIIFLLVISRLFSQSPVIEWQNSLGGSDWDQPYSISLTNDGGYIIAGYTKSINGDVPGNNGISDAWIVKIDSLGDVQWSQNYGGTDWDNTNCIKQTLDGGYLAIGYSNSNDFDVSGNHGNSDVWLLKTDSLGAIQWQKCYGGSDLDDAYSFDQTYDGGFIISGRSKSDDGDLTSNNGDFDLWLIKIDSLGNIVWQNNYGGSNAELSTSVIQTTDLGYITTGYTISNDIDVTGNNGFVDYWVVKTDSLGNMLWQKCYGGSNSDYAQSIVQTNNGGYIIAGYTNSTDGDVTVNHGLEDFWVVKIDSIGNIIWQNSYGGSSFDRAFSLQTVNNNYIIAGASSSNDGDVTGNYGSFDYWIISISDLGSIIWQNNFGGSGWDYATQINSSVDGGYIIIGYTDSNDNDVTANNGSEDYWILKLAPDTILSTSIDDLHENIKVYPNPLNNIINIKSSVKIYSLKIYNVLGNQVLYRKNIYDNNITENLHEFQSGLYIIELQTNQGTVNKKIIKN